MEKCDRCGKETKYPQQVMIDTAKRYWCPECVIATSYPKTYTDWDGSIDKAKLVKENKELHDEVEGLKRLNADLLVENQHWMQRFDEAKKSLEEIRGRSHWNSR